MEYKIVNKESFTVIANSINVCYNCANELIPDFRREHYTSGKSSIVSGKYGINICHNTVNDEFEYLIADDYKKKRNVPEGFIIRKIPEFTWAVFECIGALPDSMKEVNTYIFQEWLPNNTEYEFASGYCIEMYTDPMNYEKGIADENYYSEIWIPVKKQ